MAHCSDLDALRSMLVRHVKGGPVSVRMSLGWRLLSALHSASYTQTLAALLQALFAMPSPLTELSSFVAINADSGLAKRYRKAATTTLLADKIALGFPSLLRLYKNVLVLVTVIFMVKLLWKLQIDSKHLTWIIL